MVVGGIGKIFSETVDGENAREGGESSFYRPNFFFFYGICELKSGGDGGGQGDEGRRREGKEKRMEWQECRQGEGGKGRKEGTGEKTKRKSDEKKGERSKERGNQRGGKCERERRE